MFVHTYCVLCIFYNIVHTPRSINEASKFMCNTTHTLATTSCFLASSTRRFASSFVSHSARNALFFFFLGFSGGERGDGDIMIGCWIAYTAGRKLCCYQEPPHISPPIPRPHVHRRSHPSTPRTRGPRRRAAPWASPPAPRSSTGGPGPLFVFVGGWVGRDIGYCVMILTAGGVGPQVDRSCRRLFIGCPPSVCSDRSHVLRSTGMGVALTSRRGRRLRVCSSQQEGGLWCRVEQQKQQQQQQQQQGDGSACEGGRGVRMKGRVDEITYTNTRRTPKAVHSHTLLTHIELVLLLLLLLGRRIPRPVRGRDIHAPPLVVEIAHCSHRLLL